MKKTMKIIMTCFVFLFLLCGCSQEQKSNREINELISKFETACQSADVSGISDCLDPSFTGPVNMLMSAFDADFDMVDGVVDYILSDASFMAEYSEYRDNRDKLVEVLHSLKIRPVEYEYNESKNRCTVKANVSVDFDGETKSEESYLYCVLKNEAWYLTFDW